MISALILALCLQAPAPKVSVLGKARPWWETLKPGDVVRLYAPPGTMVPLVRLWDYSEESGFGRCNFNYLAFEDAIFDRKSNRIPSLWDEKRLWFARNRHWIKIRAIHEIWPPGPDGVKLKTPMAEVVSDLNGNPVKDAEANRLDSFFAIPVAYLGTSDQPKHPEFERLSLMVWVPGTAEVNCTSFSEAEKAWKERQRRSEEVKRRGEEEARRRAAERKK